MKALLKAAGLARSTYYYQLGAQALPDPNAEIKSQILAIYQWHKGRYGYRRITATLRQAGHVINHKAVQSLMRKLNIKSLVRVKKYQSFKGTTGKIADNLLQRQFDSDRPNKKWVTDITEFNVGSDKLYLSPVMDLFNGEIIAYRTSRRPIYDTVRAMLSDALKRLKPDEKLIFHSDQGWHYQMRHYQHQLVEHGVIQSMSRKGNCLDNAAMESFFATLKSEFFYIGRFESVEQLESQLHEYIHYYNHDRIKLKLKGLSPVQYRVQSLIAA